MTRTARIFLWLLTFVNTEELTDFYEVLNVSRFADADEIKRGYRQQSLQYHPDKFKGDPEEAQIRMVQINEAFRVLKDPKAREMYEYYPLDAEAMVQFEAELKRHHQTDPFLRDDSVNIIWNGNSNTKFGNMTHTWVVYLYDGDDPSKKKMVDEFKTFGRLTRKEPLIKAGAINCAMSMNLCQRFRIQGLPAHLIFSSLQPEDFPTDFEIFDEDRSGFPTGKELMRLAKQVINHEVVQMQTEDFWNKNITMNPRVEEDVTTTTVWFAWFFVPSICSRVEDCDRMAKALRRLSNDIVKVARVVAINCSQYPRICRKQSVSQQASTLKMLIQRKQNHFVEVVHIDRDASAAVALAAKVLELLVKPGMELYVPPHPYKKVEEIPKPTQLQADTDVNKMSLKELRQVLVQHNVKCNGCTDKREFVALVKELLPKDDKSDL